jgi:diguanylate cyclase (GGDEF)-like protein
MGHGVTQPPGSLLAPTKLSTSAAKTAVTELRLRNLKVESTRVNLDDFPNSPYAEELRRSRSWDMHFVGDLEAQYIASHTERIRLRAQVWLSLSVLLTALFGIRLVRSVGFRDDEVLLHFCVLLPCVSTLAWLAWSRHFGRWYLSAARILAPVYYGVVAAMIARALGLGYNQMAGLTMNLLAVFFLSGLMFRDSALTAVMTLTGFGVSAMYFHVSSAQFVPSMVNLTFTGLVCGFAARDMEQRYRNGYLEVALIGELVSRDGLTGLMNRRAFDDHLMRVWQHAMRDRRSIAVLMIDIDHFKEFNDGFGHQAGDVALRSVAQSVQESARRPLDIAARFGGEEFAVIFYDLSPSHVHEMAEHIRQRVQGLQITRPPAGGMPEPVTVSIGVGLVSPSLGRTPQGAVQLADEALYEAKRGGRNRVTVRGVEDYMLLDTGQFKNSQVAHL